MIEGHATAILAVVKHEDEVLFGSECDHASELVVLALALSHYLIQSLQPSSASTTVCV